jgi:hypothetical protein
MLEHKGNTQGKVSIIIPCYNDWKYVEEAVNSALAQSYQPIEIIIVDDGSSEKTKAVLKRIEPKITKLITQENQGQSVARNVGIKAATGKFILTLDSDDFFEPSFCEKAIQVILGKHNVKIVSCHTQLLFENGTASVFETVGGELASFLCKNNALGSALFKKEDWLNCGGYDEKMKQGFEDWEFYIRLLKSGGSAEIIPELLYTYRKRINTTTDKAERLKYELLNYIYLKHQDLYKENFELFIKHILYRLEREEIEKLKNTQRLEFRIGYNILMPLRTIKKIFNL